MLACRHSRTTMLMVSPPLIADNDIITELLTGIDGMLTDVETAFPPEVSAPAPREPGFVATASPGRATRPTRSTDHDLAL